MSALDLVRAAGAGACIFALACSSGSVPRFAPCGASDSCASATTCQSVGPSLGSMCTWSCNVDDIDPQACPNDSSGKPAVCAGLVGGAQVGSSYAYGMCFQSCVTTADCPDGSACISATALDSQSPTQVCAAVPSDAIAGTSWQSATITKTAMSNGVQTSTYTMTFGPQTGYDNGLVQGTFTATLVQVYGTSQSHPYAGCTETTTYTGGTWNDRAPTPTQVGNLAISGTSSSTDRTGCTFSDSDVTGEPDDYSMSNGVAGYYLSTDGNTMNLGGGYGSLPYDDSVEWTFTKQ